MRARIGARISCRRTMLVMAAAATPASSMTTHRDLREEIWRGWVPLQISIAFPETYDECTYLLAARRNAFLPSYTPQVVAYFKRYLAIDASSDEWWFEAAGQPLPWSRPIGVLYDAFADPGTVWCLRVRHLDYPAQILPVSNDLFTDYWRNQFKEACYTRDGNANSVMNLPRDKSHALFMAATDPAAEATDFWSIAEPLLRNDMQSIPLRIYKPKQVVPLRQTVPLREDDGEIRSLGTVLNLLLPDEFPSARSCSEYVPYVHGAPIELSARVDEVYRATMFVDGFLHISLV